MAEPEPVEQDDDQPDLDAATARATRHKSGKQPGMPKHTAIPRQDAPGKQVRGGRFVEPLSPAECEHALYGIYAALAGILGSTPEPPFEFQDFRQSGAALADISKWLPYVRPAFRVVSPLMFVGLEAGHVRRLWDGIPDDGWPRRFLAARARQSQQGWQPQVVEGYGMPVERVG